MNVYTFMICILLTSVSDYKSVFSRSTYDNPSYNNDRDESLSVLSAHQKKRLANEDALREEEQPEEYEHNAPLYEGQRFRKYDPETSYARHDNRLEKNRELADFDENKINTQKREYYDVANSPKDASIEVILDPRAKKAVAVVENSPSGQAMYDLSSWKNNKDDSSAYDSDQYTPGTQEQVVNLVYPAERNERKYSANAFESNSDYSEKAKGGFKDKLMDSDRTAEDTHKRKRNADTKNKSDKENEKRNSEDKSKRKSDQKSDSKSNDCPPHNTPSTMESDSNKNDDENKFTKQQTVKRETPQWSQQQLDALKNSLAHVNDNSGEVQNLKNILTDMGLINEGQLTKKRETAKMDTTSSPTEKLEEDKEKMNNNDLKADIEDEDLNQDNIILKRNGREVTHEGNEEDVNKAPMEPLEKRDADENMSEEEENEETFDTQDEKKDIKRSNTESEVVNTNAKEETNAKEVAQSREKRQDAETNQQNIKAETIEKSKDIPTSESDINKNTNDNTKKYVKRESNSDTSKELRKNRQNQETDEEYEKRMESQIQAKIDAIKEKVKREILEEQFKRRYKRNPNIEEAFRTNVRQRRQTKEEMKVVKDTENINKEKSIESPDIPSEQQAKIVRRKRANTLPEKQMVYRAYQADQDEEVEDDGEFDDNAFDGRMYLEKRQAEDENDYFDPVRKREVEGYLQQYYPEARNRRSFSNDGFAEDSNAFHGSRRALKNKSFTGRENQEEYNAKSNENNDNEYFGSLPQTYNGELTRYKRVKRDNPYK